MGKKNGNDNQPKTRKELKGRKDKGEFKGNVYSTRHIREVERLAEKRTINGSKNNTQHNTNSTNIIL